VIKHVAAPAGCLDRHPEDLLEPLLTDEVGKRARSQRKVELLLLL
jgi:hypothetical protein